ncbi:TetR/AcrR family transcriptional regulator [Nocardioides marinquilinus]|uniref:TetR/AcrR family transcriptional regulator n=1 Tax=Nocardioides marinquilinus TaxID=1210400 RepID=A0ABP9P7G2_9ACTN
MARDDVRQRIVEAAAGLAGQGGSEALTTRAVAGAAGVQAPTIYRIFGDKDGLVDAVVEHLYADFVASKQAGDVDTDPVADLGAGWDLAVQFGLQHPALHAMTHERGAGSPALQEGLAVLRGKVARVAAAGRLAVPEQVAVAVLRATGDAAVRTWLALPDDARDPAVLGALRDAALTTVTTTHAAVDEPGLAAAARTLRARLDASDDPGLTDPELALLHQWLHRLAAGG